MRTSRQEDKMDLWYRRAKECLRGFVPVQVVCPKCSCEIPIDREKIGADVECPDCHDAFTAVEAVKCEKCGGLRHPEHPCWKCFPDNDDARAYREERKRKMLDRLPEMLDEMAERINELEERINELESELEELKEEGE